MFPRDARIEGYDPELAAAIASENRRQEDHVELIASENYASPRVMEAQGSQLTNKYAEGYPGKRYYGGCEYVDVAEQLAIDRVKQLFGAGSTEGMYANVQPHSGSQANQAVYFALLQPGDTILGMSLAHGGHLTHGAKPNISGKVLDAVQYGVNDDGLIDYDEVERLAVEHKPKMVVAGFSAYSQEIDWARFRAIADKVGAWFFVDMAHVAGLIAAGEYPNPVPHAHVVTSTTHKTLRGPRGGIIVASREGAGDRFDEMTKKLQSIVFPGIQGGPLMHVIAAKAVAFKEALEPEFKAYQQQVVKNAQAMAKVIIDRGYRIVSGGTQNHLMLVDMIGKGITGKDAEAALGKANITVNKNAVPNDPQKPFVTSGLRIGTPAVTTRGYKEPDCVALANWMCDVLDAPNDENVIAGVRENVKKQCAQFPVYG
ncbi:serine hydroxymethyltransferase [Luteimonas soli]|uniref:Serine hydroxymethyltransferase n=1 Tax=Luteimonas soli TaxID=1648966 RepID=A0ABV7XJG1_9GAMM